MNISNFVPLCFSMTRHFIRQRACPIREPVTVLI